MNNEVSLISLYADIVFPPLFLFPLPPRFRWTKDGDEFDPGSDPELKVSERAGSMVFYTASGTMETLKQYQGKYVCFASNELGTAVSNEVILNTDSKPRPLSPPPDTVRPR